jgi:3-hydroxybutyryl-CoA dehydratase
MSDWRRDAAEERVTLGTTVRFSRTFTDRDVLDFARLTRDYNPVHLESRFCEGKGFTGPICHGLLVGSMICEPGGQWAWLASEMHLRFLRPVYIGDTVTCELTIRDLDERRFARADARFTNQQGELVLEAQLAGFLPKGEECSTLRAMLDSGDPTNPLSKSS